MRFAAQRIVSPSGTALYALIEADAGWGGERYRWCVSPLFAAFLCLAAALISHWVRRRRYLKQT